MRIFFIFLLAGLTLQGCKNETKSELPILGHREPVERQVEGKTVVDTIYQTIEPFSYLNQDSTLVTEKDFNGKIYVADFFFTSCNTICPVMHRNMLNVYEKFKGNPKVKFLSHSIDSKYDVPSKLKKYADKLGIEGTQWEFVHGSSDSIYNVSAKNYLVAAYEDKTDPQGFVHQGWFILVDENKHMRGAYDGTKDDQVEQMVADMQILLNEKKTNEK
ncbi:SCO family protein [Daejeonella oryzae]|uniref:SCO family protein n=1 Tax=Daejeonella oryzae TaxID=1122943 RepID=UPI00040E56EB|nr:SCO family protein [Daejeonella oryzae]